MGATSLLPLTPVRRIKYQKNHEIVSLPSGLVYLAYMSGSQFIIGDDRAGIQGKAPQPETMEEYCLLAHSLAHSLTHSFTHPPTGSCSLAFLHSPELPA